MKYNSKIHNRKSIRLKDYDYSQAGFYFITICTQNQLNLFGEIVNDEMILNNAGVMVDKIWLENPNHFTNTKLHEFVIMPNHIHGIVEITPVGGIVGAFKSLTTNNYIKMVKQSIVAPFNKRIWQRNYWEHIIRNDDEYNYIAQYIVDNPKKWALDTLNGGDGNQLIDSSVDP